MKNQKYVSNKTTIYTIYECMLSQILSKLKNIQKSEAQETRSNRYCQIEQLKIIQKIIMYQIKYRLCS